MAYQIPTLDETTALMLAQLSASIPELNLGTESVAYKIVRAVALGVTDAHYHTRTVALDLFPDTASGDALTRWGGLVGTPRRGATSSSSLSALRIYGSPSILIPTGTTFSQQSSGLSFTTTADATISSLGYVDAAIIAVETGAQTNLPKGQELTIGASILDVEDTALLIKDLDNGSDQESDGNLRKRVIQRLGEPASGGNRLDYEEFAKAAADYVDSVFVYPNRNGIGTVDIACLKAGSGSSRLLSTSENNEVLAYVDTVRPVSAIVRVLTVVEKKVRVEVEVLPKSDALYSFDWNDSAGVTVASYDAGTRTVTVNGIRPVDMIIGDRITFSTVDDSNTGESFVVESFSGTDGLVLEDGPVFSVLAGDNIYSGGAIVDSVRQSILDLFDSLGTANPDGLGYGQWQGNLRLSLLFEAIVSTTVSGRDVVLDSTIVEPLAQVEGADSIGEEVELITPSTVIVRERHS